MQQCFVVVVVVVVVVVGGGGGCVVGGCNPCDARIGLIVLDNAEDDIDNKSYYLLYPMMTLMMLGYPPYSWINHIIIGFVVIDL